MMDAVLGAGEARSEPYETCGERVLETATTQYAIMKGYFFVAQKISAISSIMSKSF